MLYPLAVYFLLLIKKKLVNLKNVLLIDDINNKIKIRPSGTVVIPYVCFSFGL